MTVFDFIIVGAGTAGSVVAARLAEMYNWNILLLEAGGDPPMTSDVPYFHQSLQRTDVDWFFTTQREEGLYNGYMGRVNRWPRGKVMGGTSTISSMLYIRPNSREHDTLASINNPGWAYDDVLPYYRKSEDIRSLRLLQDKLSSLYHAQYGPLPLSQFGYNTTLVDAIMNATLDLGYATSYDINGINSAGFVFPNYGMVVNGERVSTARAFLSRIRHKKNLFVIKHAFVSKVHVCPKTMRAYAVEYYYRNERKARVARASREIILSAGTVGTTKILLLSGIGPKNDLDELGIYVVQNLRVGRNLQDHAQYPYLPISLNNVSTGKSPLDCLDASYEYLTRRTGIFSTIGLTELVGILNMDDDDLPDIQVQFTYFDTNDTELVKDYVKAFGFEEDNAVHLLTLNGRSDVLMAQVFLLHPKSRGWITIKSKDPDDVPIIVARYMDHPDDLDNIMVGIRFIENMAKNDFMTKYNASLEFYSFPGCCGLDFGNDYYWACALSHLAGTGYSPVGTCKMGPCEDPDAVVDPQLRVVGVKGLRVADASIVPNALTGSIIAAVIMIAEKVSDLIKAQWVPNFVPEFSTRSPWRPNTVVPTASKKKFRLPYQYVPDYKLSALEKFKKM